MNKDIGVVVCTHGNETIGLEVFNKKKYQYPFFIGNPYAFEKNKRFIDLDLNRIFPGKLNGNYEEHRAYHLKKNLSKFKYVIDIHSSTNDIELFAIITKPNQEKIRFVKRLGVKKLVIMNNTIASGKSLIDHVNNGVSLEIGPHNNKNDNLNKLMNVFKHLETNNINNDLEIFEVYDKLLDSDVIVENFIPITINKETFYPVLVGEKYTDNFVCFKARKING